MARSKMARTDYRAKNKQHSGRSRGLIKKADELSLLCGANVYVVIQDQTLHGLFVEAGIFMASTVIGNCNYLPPFRSNRFSNSLNSQNRTLLK